MQLKKVTTYFERFQEFLGSPDADQRLYIWESQRIFQEEWDPDHPRLEEMYHRSLNNSQTRRLWVRESYEPKNVMKKLLAFQPDYGRQMFQDLFNEEKSIDGRVDRFVFYCDQLLYAYLEANPKSRVAKHYHGNDYEMISLYLSFRYPRQYTLFRFDLFVAVAEKLGMPNLPQANDVERYFKISRTIYKLMEKETELLAAHQERLQSGFHYTEPSLLLVYDFFKFIQSTKD